MKRCYGLRADGFQINDLAIYTIKDASGELVCSGVAPLQWLEGSRAAEAVLELDGLTVLMRAEEINEDPKKVGSNPGQTRRYFAGPVLSVDPRK